MIRLAYLFVIIFFLYLLLFLFIIYLICLFYLVLPYFLWWILWFFIYRVSKTLFLFLCHFRSLLLRYYPFFSFINLFLASLNSLWQSERLFSDCILNFLRIKLTSKINEILKFASLCKIFFVMTSMISNLHTLGQLKMINFIKQYLYLDLLSPNKLIKYCSCFWMKFVSLIDLTAVLHFTITELLPFPTEVYFWNFLCLFFLHQIK